MKNMVFSSHPQSVFSIWCIVICFTWSAWGQRFSTRIENRSSTRHSSEQEKLILKSVGQLSSSEYRKRAAATSKLIEIGIPAIPHIGRKANENDPESRQRCFQILRKLATGKKPETSRAALSELESLTESTNKKTLVVAKHTMNQIRQSYRTMIKGIGALIETYDKQKDDYSASLNLSYCKEKTIAFHLLQYLWNINSINLNYSQINFQSLVWLGTLTHLESLEMKQVNLSDGELRFLEKLVRLKKLDLSSTSITDRNLSSLRGLVNLEYCNLSLTNLSNKGIKTLGNLKNLKELNLSGTNIDDGGTAFLSSCRNLEILRLKNTRVSDKTLQRIRGLKKLRVLSLSGTQISDKGLVHLKNRKTLQSLWLSRTSVTTEGAQLLMKSLPQADIFR